jgi:hypothetical protein
MYAFFFLEAFLISKTTMRWAVTRRTCGCIESGSACTYAVVLMSQNWRPRVFWNVPIWAGSFCRQSSSAVDGGKFLMMFSDKHHPGGLYEDDDDDDEDES